MEVHISELETVLDKAEVMYLSTSINDVVSARPVSPLNIGLRLFVRTSSSSRKGKEMIANPNIAICVGNFYMTGKATCLGSVHDENNKEIKQAYKQRYCDSFSDEDDFIESDEAFFELTIEHISQWIYDQDIPIALAEKTI